MFKIVSDFSPQGDQPEAIKKIIKGFSQEKREQVLLGVTGSGKTFTMANVIQSLQKRTLVLAPNKTLAAQLYSEFKEFFPENAVEYFVSYYDYYQPEAYVPGTDTFIEKDASINEEIDKLRHSATRSLLEREDTIVVASVSCIYGIGSPDEYESQKITLFVGNDFQRDQLLRNLIAIQYSRNDYDFHRGTFRVRGEIIEIFPAHEDSNVIRLEFFDNELESISVMDPLKGIQLQQLNKITIYPMSHYVVGQEKMRQAVKTIRKELRVALNQLRHEGKLVEEQRLNQRTQLDLEMIEEMGFCSGIENYSRHLTGREEGEAPPTLIDFFKKDFLLIIDESHLTIPQVGGMYKGDRSRKKTLVEYGFRLPSALDNRPLNFSEFEKRLDKIVYVSATPGPYELERTGGEYIEQIIRPTGLLDPVVEVRSAASQVDDLLIEAKTIIKKGERVLITTLTKKLAEELTHFYKSVGLKIKYLHSDISTIERMEIIRDLRLGEFDILVGINLLREGLDIPEVSLVAILDADKEGFLRSNRSLIQTMGRAARNAEGRVILYAYEETESMKKAMEETRRRREIQTKFNETHQITPETIQKKISGGVIDTLRSSKKGKLKKEKSLLTDLDPDSMEKHIKSLKKKMKEAARDLNFEEAAKIRDEIKDLTQMRMTL